MGLHLSDLARHNDEAEGYWIAVADQLYDISRFLAAHPGGSVVLVSTAGRDATADFQAIRHHANPRVAAMLKTLHIGALERLTFSDAGTRTLYEHWSLLCDLIVNMENTLSTDLSVLTKRCTAGDGGDLSPYKIDLLLETHYRFVSGYLPSISQKVGRLLALLAAQPLRNAELESVLLAVSADAVGLRWRNARARELGGCDEAAWDAQMLSGCHIIGHCNTGLIARIKLEIIRGLVPFERYSPDMTARLADRCAAIDQAICAYAKDMRRFIQTFDSLPIGEA